MQKPLYVDAIAYFEKMEKKHAYQANKAKWQGRSEQEIENIQRKRNMQDWQWRHCGRWRSEVSMNKVELLGRLTKILRYGMPKEKTKWLWDGTHWQ